MNKPPKNNVLTSPFQLLVFALLGGPLVAGPIGTLVFYRKSRPLTAILLALISIPLGIGLISGAFLLEYPWYWLSLLTLACHILYAGVLFWITHKLVEADSAPLEKKKTGNHRHILAGIFGGALLAMILGSVVTGGYLLFTDRLFSSWFPVVFDDSQALSKCLIQIFFLALAGGLTGGFIGYRQPGLRPGRMLTIVFLFFWIEFTWLLSLELLIGLPAFQAGAATVKAWQAIWIPYVAGNLLVGIWLPIFLLSYIDRVPDLVRRSFRAMQVALINLGCAMTLAILFGYPTEMFLTMGRSFERTNNLDSALWCYEQGLVKNPDEQLASYLQYRVALLDHTLGHKQKAIQGFQRLVAKHSDDEKLVAKASRFLDNIEQHPEGKRVLLSGVNMRTEYQGGYCVPNSLALVMQFWGHPVTARDIGCSITGLGSGTFIVNQAWFADNQGFRHDFLPLASMDDIKQSIDAGFPVLVYVPAHVFAIVGYDEGLQTFITYDVATSDIWSEYLQKDFIKSWKRQVTTLALVYPPEQENNIPASIRARLGKLSDSYLHYQIYSHTTESCAQQAFTHLKRATQPDGAFFPAVTMLYSEFPSQRQGIATRFDQQQMTDQITSFFRNDYDEGLHLWGQLHFDNAADQDRSLYYALNYLIGIGRHQEATELLQHINDQGELSEESLALVGLINLSFDRMETGLDQLRQSEDDEVALYTGLAQLRMGDINGAVANMVKTVPRRSGYG